MICAEKLLMSFFFFFNDTATTEIYTLSLHDALPIYRTGGGWAGGRSGDTERPVGRPAETTRDSGLSDLTRRSEEHTSELQSRLHLVCRLLLEKKKKKMLEFTRGAQTSTASCYCTTPD